MNVAKWETYADRNRSKILAIVGAVAGVIQAWTSRGTLAPDLLNYLALAKTLLGNGWTSATNGFWSPFYSWLLAVPMYFHLMTPSTELLWVHLVNLGIFFTSMLCFHVFLSHALRLAALRVGPGNPSWPRIELWWYFTACAIFLFAVFNWLPNSLGTPDLLVASFILLSAGFLAAILCRDRSWPNYFVLGTALAMGYLSKAPCFPLALVFLAMLPFLSRGEKWWWAKCLLAVAAFGLVAGPFLYTLSKKEGHPTFGDSGRVNFMMYANGLPAYWLGEGISKEGVPPSYDTVCAEPPVFAFREVPTGVFFPDYEPSRWYAGLVPHLQFKQGVQNLRENLHRLGGMAETESDLALGFLLLLFLSGAAKGLRSVLYWWFLWLPAVAGIGMFWIVHVEERFIAPFVVLGFVGLYTGALIANARRPRIVIHVLLAILLLQGGRATLEAVKGILGTPVSAQNSAARIVYDLQRNGVPPGSKVAVIGFNLAAYWAWIGQYSIVGEVPSSGAPRFLSASKTERERTYSCLAKTGAKAALMHAESPEFLEPAWQKVGLEDLYVRPLASGRDGGN
jgi:hypothetical protein